MLPGLYCTLCLRLFHHLRTALRLLGTFTERDLYLDRAVLSEICSPEELAWIFSTLEMQYFPLEMPLKNGGFSTTDASSEPFHLSRIETSPLGFHNEGESLLEGSATLSCLED